jgi:hypothetical protein
MVANRIPWRVESNIMSSAGGGLLLVRCFRVIAEVDVLVGGSTERASLMARVDKTNLGELFLGQTSQHGDAAVVLSDVLVVKG